MSVVPACRPPIDVWSGARAAAIHTGTMPADADLSRARPGSVVRSGRLVRRQAGEQSSAVQALLQHLADVGFEGAPRPRGIEDGEEVVEYIGGVDGHHARDPRVHSSAVLAEVARLVRRFHDAVADFEPPADAQWRFLADAPTTGIVCHNDLAPVNTIYVDHWPIAFIDWDFAAPAPPLWDVACAAWSFLPLSSDEFCRRYGYSTDARGPRLRAFCDAYGLDERGRGRLLDTVRARQESIFETVRRGAEAGDRHYAAVWAQSGGRRWRDDIAYLDVHRDEWQQHLD